MFPFVSNPSYHDCAKNSVKPDFVTVASLTGRNPDCGLLSSIPGAIYKKIGNDAMDKVRNLNAKG